MKHALLIVGDSLRLNPLAQSYIIRVYEEYFGHINTLEFSPKSNSNLPFMIEELAKKYDYLTIFATKESFALVSKIAATLTEDVLSLKEDMLVPSRVTKAQKGSYILNFLNCHINIVCAIEGGELPSLLFEEPKRQAINFHLVGLDDEACRILLEPLVQTFEVNMLTATYIEGWIQAEAYSSKYGNVSNFVKSVNELFRGKMFIAKNPIEHLVKCLEKSGKTITVAESCTGGLISSLITSVSGASSALDGALTTYSNEIKTSWLGVDEEILNSFGAVSEETVRGMLEGALKASNAHMAMATSGIAGPSGGSASKPVGTVFVGVANKDGNYFVERLLLQGDRKYIQMQSAYYAFKLLFELEKEIFF